MARKSRAKKPRQPPSGPSVQRFQIQTYGGNTVLPADSWVWARVGGQAARKKVRDLRAGDAVLERNTTVSLTLEQIKAALAKDDIRYRMAHQALYTTPPEAEVHVTRLQSFLHHALKKEGFENPQELHGEPLSNAVDRIRRRLSSIESKIGSRYGRAAGMERSESAVRQWLSGQTVLPSDSLTLRALRRLDRNKFDELFGTPQELQAGGLDWAHERWQSTHQTLMHWIGSFSDLARASGREEFTLPQREETGKTGEPARERKAGESLAESRRIVYEQLIKPIYEKVSAEHAFVRVKRMVPLGRGPPQPSGGGPTLSRGVVTHDKADPAQLGIGQTDIAALHRELTILDYTARKVMEGYIARNVVNRPEMARMRGSRGGFGSVIAALVVMQLTEGLDSSRYEAVTVPRVTPGEQGENVAMISVPIEKAVNIARESVEWLRRGSLDRQAGMPEGTMLDIMQRIASLHQAVPQRLTRALTELHAAVSDTMNITPAKSRTIVGEVNRLGRIISEYDIEPDGVLIPERIGVRTAEELKSVLGREGDKERKWLGITAPWPKRPPPTEDEVRRAFANAGVQPGSLHALVGVYGRQNFIKLTQ